MRSIQIHPSDNVAVALEAGRAGDTLTAGEQRVPLRENVPAGHKAALREIREGEAIIKYGFPIGTATQDIPAGAWVHTHNVRTGLGELLEYSYKPDFTVPKRVEPRTFMGYLRKDGSAGIRNEIWILPTVGCINGVARRLEEMGRELVGEGLEGVYAFAHPHGCSQCGGDLRNTQALLSGLVRNPNAGGVLVLGLGCECNHLEAFRAVLGDVDGERVKFLNCQDSEDELREGMTLLRELSGVLRKDKRQEISAEKLVIGLKCGGSDGFSGITGNPTVGNFSDRLISMGGTTILTEVPEMFGAETILMDRCRDRETFDRTVEMINGFKRYFMRYGETIYDNPSPGNKAGGITTLEDKSLGCTQKGGTAPVCGVLAYGERVREQGLNLLWAPGNDLVASTACAAAGAQLVLFTTGRGTPFGCPVPTVKIATNRALAERKANWIDFNASPAAEGTPIPEMGEEMLELVLRLASGEEKTKNEVNGYREISIFKDGVTE